VRLGRDRSGLLYHKTRLIDDSPMPYNTARWDGINLASLYSWRMASLCFISISLPGTCSGIGGVIGRSILYMFLLEVRIAKMTL
jgi:hypothetical protein